MLIIIVSLLFLFIVYLIWRLYFLRDPCRKIPAGNNMTSPADGYVLYIKKIEKGELPISVKNKEKIPLSEITRVTDLNEGGILIGIYMTPFSVHINRAPLAGEIVTQVYYRNSFNYSMTLPFIESNIPGKLARNNRQTDEFFLINEKMTTGIKTERGTVFVIQIADKWIDRIVSWVAAGDSIEKGERFGMIRFGSQCDVFIPDTIPLEITIKIGEYIYAGASIIGEIKEA